MQCPKFTFVNIATISLEKVFKYWKVVKLAVVDIDFPKFSFLFEILSLATSTASGFL